MEDLEQKIGQILSDPDAMLSILSLAKNLGLTPPEGESGPNPDQPQAPQDPPQAQQAAAMGGIESLLGSLGGLSSLGSLSGLGSLVGGSALGADELLGALPSVMGLLSEANHVDTKQAALFNALKPYLKPDRREKIDKALQAARLSHVAGYALRNWHHNP